MAGDAFDAGLVSLMGAVTLGITEGFAELIGLDDPRTYNCDGPVIDDTIKVTGRQLHDWTENSTHSFLLNDGRLLELSNSHGITASEHGAGYMGVGDAPRQCGSRSLYEMNVTVRRVDTYVPPNFINQLGACEARTLQPADSAPRAEWNGTWADASQRIRVDIAGRGYLTGGAMAWRYQVNSREGESAYGRISRIVTENAGAATLSNQTTVTHATDKYCCSSQLIKAGVPASPDTPGRAARSSVRQTQAIALPDNVELQLFEGCLASAPRSEKYHLRYLRTDSSGHILADVILSKSQAPVR